MRFLATMIVLAGFAGAPALAIEEPEFEVIEQTEDYEIRRYAPYIVAEVDVTGDMRNSGGRAFRVLAGYIFGDNQPRQKMAMTAPVESAPRGVKMNMTAPVESAVVDGQSYTYAFVMERKYAMDELPVPNDSRIRLVQRPARIVAARRFSGWARQADYDLHSGALVAALERDTLTARSTPVLAQYNGPYTPGAMRRNEILIEIDWPAAR